MNENEVSPLLRLFKKMVDRAKEKRIFAEVQGQVITYAHLRDSVRLLSSFFARKKFVKGDRILLISKHDGAVIEIFIAALFNDLTPIVLSADSKSDRVRAVAGKVRPVCVFIDAELHKEWSWLERYDAVAVTGRRLEEQGLLKRLLSRSSSLSGCYPNLLGGYDQVDPSCNALPEDNAYILFTSGTTSAPKGILASHRNLFSHLETFTKVFSYDQDKKIFNNLSLAHADGLFQGPLLALYSGAILYRPEAFAIQNIETLFNGIFKKRVTHLVTVPTVLSLADRLLAHDDYFSGNEFCNIISVAAKIDTNLWQRLEKRFHVSICNIYGLTETVSGGVFCGPDEASHVLGTIGKPVDMEARIIAENGTDCGIGQEGELWLRGENSTPGYLDNPEATAELYVGDWLRTGDIAKRRTDGCIEIIGRKKSVIISGGFNVFPDEVTEVLLLHPDVIDAVTIGVSDRDWGELVVCAIETQKDLDEENLIAHCRANLENFKVPKRIVRFTELPRGISGKARLNEIRSILEGERPSTPENGSKVALEEILLIAAKVFNTSATELDADRPPADIPGWDSLGHLNLISAVEERYTVQFSVDEMMKVNSLSQLHDILCSKSRVQA